MSLADPFEVNRRLVAPREALPARTEVDAVTAGIIRGAFETICYESATHLGRAASSAIIGIACTADDPVPMTPTRRPVKSTASCGQAPV